MWTPLGNRDTAPTPTSAGSSAVSVPAAQQHIRSPRMAWERQDHHLIITAIGLVGLATAIAMALWGLPPVDLHGPLHRLGVMDPLCGGTRAAYFTMRGDFARAWLYNPLGILAVVAALAAAVRVLAGVATGRWLTLAYTWTPRRRRLAFALAFALLALLEVRQQLHADLLMARS